MATQKIAPAERWRPVPGYEGLYSVSDLGRVRRDRTTTCTKAGKVLSSAGLRMGYPSLQLSKDNRRKSFAVHRLVAAAFIGARPTGQEVNHINGVKTDNRLSNLEYLTSSANQLHAFRTGLQDCSGSRNGRSKLTEADVRAIRRASTGKRGEQAAFARQYGVTPSAIRKVINRTRWEGVE